MRLPPSSYTLNAFITLCNEKINKEKNSLQIITILFKPNKEMKISEVFKNRGFNGIAYRSSLGKGHNIALFNLEVADLINCTLFQVKEISFNFSQASNAYFISKYYKK